MDRNKNLPHVENEAESVWPRKDAITVRCYGEYLSKTIHIYRNQEKLYEHGSWKGYVNKT